MTIREKVARAIGEARTPTGRELRGDDLAHLVAYHGPEATAAITAFLEAAAEEGWRMCRDEATEEMVVAGCRHENMGDMAGRYHAMLAAADEFEWDK